MRRLDAGGCARLAGGLVALSLPAFFAPLVGERMQALAFEIDPARAYFPWVRPGLMYVAVPLTVLSANVLVLAPGLVLALFLSRGRSLWEWLLEGFAISLVVLSVAAGVVQAALGRALIGVPFAALALGLTAVAGWALHRRARGGRAVSSPFGEHARAALGLLFAVPAIFLVALTPKFFWEAFNGDGTHVFEATRLLLHQPLPFFPAEAGRIALWPGTSSFAFVYPASWFLRLFGENEAAVRLVFLLFLQLLAAGVVAVAEAGRRERLGPRALALVLGSLIGYALVMSYSATYDPYCADIALPATQDTLLMALFFAALAAFVRRDAGWTAFFALLALATSPAATVLSAAFLAGVLLVSRNWRLVARYGAGFAACLAALAALPRVLAALGFPLVGSEHDAGELLEKFRYVAVADFERFAYAALPCGIYPLAGLIRWGRSDLETRAMIFVTLSIFATYYLVSVGSLHYFVPAMLLPLAIFWRQQPAGSLRAPAFLACAAGVVAAIALALPRGPAIHVAAREVGERIDVRELPGYGEMRPAVFAASENLRALFPRGTIREVPDELYGGSSLAWLHYACSAAPADPPKSYALARPDAPPPPGATQLLRDEVAAVYVLDEATWRAQREMQPLHSRGSAIFDVPRDVLFWRGDFSLRPGLFANRPLMRLLGPRQP